MPSSTWREASAIGVLLLVVLLMLLIVEARPIADPWRYLLAMIVPAAFLIWLLAARRRHGGESR